MTDLSRWCALSLSMALHLIAVLGLTLPAPTRNVRSPQAIMVVLEHMTAPDLRRTEPAEASERAGRLPVAAPVSARRLVASNLQPGVEPEKASRQATQRASQQETPQAIRQAAEKMSPDEMSAPVRSEPLQSPGPATLPAEPSHSLHRSQGATETATGAVSRPRAAGAAGSPIPQAALERPPQETGQQRYLIRQFGYIQELIAKRIVYPPLARRMNWSGKTVLSFSILEDGSVHGIRVVQSSGHAVLDQSALATVRRAAPFPKPPARAEIVVPINFRMEP